MEYIDSGGVKWIFDSRNVQFDTEDGEVSVWFSGTCSMSAGTKGVWVLLGGGELIDEFITAEEAMEGEAKMRLERGAV